MNINPSYGTGFARNKYESEFPELWDGLVGVWPFFLGATGPNVIDWSGNHNNGAITGANWLPGILGLGLNFDANTELITVQDSPSLAPITGLTLMAWIKRTGASGDDWGRIIHKQQGATGDDWALSMQSPGGTVGNALAFRINTDAGQTTIDTGVTALTQDIWYHVAATWDGDNMIIYLDGQVDATDNQLGTLDTTGSPLGIGRHIASNTRNFVGIIDQPIIWNRKLSRNEIEIFLRTPKALFISRRRVFGFVATAGSTFFETPSDAILLAESLSKDVTVIESDTTILSDALSKDLTIPISDAISIADAPVITVTLPISDIITVSEATAITIQKVVSDSIAIADTPTLTVQLDVTDVITITESLLKQINIAPEDAVSIAEAIVKTISLAEADGIVLTDSVVTGIQGITNQVEAEIIVLSDSVVTVVITGPAVKTRKDPITRDSEDIEWQEIIDIERGVE